MIETPKLTIWTDGPRVAGYEPPRELDTIRKWPVLDLREALLRRWEGDAHLVPYWARGRDTCPRINKNGLPVLRERGIDVVIGSLFFDIDAPDHGAGLDVGGWWSSEVLPRIAELDTPPAWYRTRGGGRLLWMLPEPIPVEDFEIYHAAYSDVLLAAGLAIDPACKDWTRCYRLPRTTREGVPQDHPLSLDTIPTLHYTPPPVSEPAPRGSRLDEARRRHRFSHTPHKGVSGLVDLFGALGLYVRPIGSGKHAVGCPWDHEHSGGNPGDSSSVLLSAPDGGHNFHCSHAHCDGRGSRAVQELYPDEWAEYVGSGGSRGSRSENQSVCGRTSPDTEARPTLSIAESRDAIAERLERLVVIPGTHQLAGATGLGKTYAAVRQLAGCAIAGRSSRLGIPTRELRDEVAIELERALAEAEDGHGSGVVVDVARGREPGICEWPDTAQARLEAGGPEAVKSGCGECVSRPGCKVYSDLERKARRLPPTAIITVGTHAMFSRNAAIGESPDDIVVIDECPLATWAPTESITAEEIAVGLGHGSIVFDDPADIVAIMRAIKSGDRYADAGIAELVEGTIEADGAAAVLAVQTIDVTHGWGTTGQREALASLPPIAAIEALAKASRDDWRGVYIQDNAIHIQTEITRAEDLGAESLVYLDASASAGLCEALGVTPDEPLPCEVPNNVRLKWLPINAGKRNARRNWLVSNALHKAHDDKKTVHFTHKGLRENPGPVSWIGEVVGVVDHFGSASTRGTNRFDRFTRVVLDSWYIPKNAIRALAQQLARSAGDDEWRGRWEDEARRQCLQSELDQIVGRLRANLRPDEEIEVVYCSPEPIAFGGLHPDTPTERLRVNDLLWDQYGIRRNARALREYWLDRAGQARHALVWDSDGEGNRVLAGGDIKGLCHERPTLGDDSEPRRYKTFSNRVLLRQTGLGHRNPTRWLESIGLTCTRVRLARGGSPLVRYLVHAGIEGVELDAYALARSIGGVEWYQLDGGPRVYTSQNRLYRAAKAIEAARREVTPKALSGACGVRLGTIYAALAQRGVRPSEVRAFGSAALAPTTPAERVRAWYEWEGPGELAGEEATP